MLMLKLYSSVAFTFVCSVIFTSLDFGLADKEISKDEYSLALPTVKSASSILVTRNRFNQLRMNDRNDSEKYTNMFTFCVAFNITFRGIKSNRTESSTVNVSSTEPISIHASIHPSIHSYIHTSLRTTDAIKVPPWFLCLILKPPPSYCDLLNIIKGTPIVNVPSTPCVTLVHTFPGIPPFRFPDPDVGCCLSQDSELSDGQDEKKKMLFQVLCTLIRPAPSWCPNVYRDEILESDFTTEKCDDVTDVALPGWVLCFVFKPTPPFCKKYDKQNEVDTTCATIMYTGIPPFPPPCPPIMFPCDNKSKSTPKDLPWWILCPVIKPLPDWCPDIFRCILTPGLEVTESHHITPTTTEFPWWKLCEVLKPRPKECDFITPPQEKSTPKADSNHWWVCVIVKPPPDWCKYITIPSTLLPSTLSDLNSLITETISREIVSVPTNIPIKPTNIQTSPLPMDVDYPLWWMCIIQNPPPYWCKNVTFPTDISKTDYPKDIEEGKSKVSLFMYCWWWLCEVFKLWATWCKNLPPPPKGLVDTFPENLPPNNFMHLPVPPLIIEFP